MAIEFVEWVPEDLWDQLTQIAEVTGEAPIAVALTILRAGTEARVALMVQEAEAERSRLESELTAVQARLSGLNGLPKAPERPVEPSNAETSVYHYSAVRKAVKGILGADRSRTFTMPEVLEQLAGLGYETAGMYQQVNNALRALVTDGEARRPVRGQYTWRRRPSKP